MGKITDFDRFGMENLEKEEYTKLQDSVIKNCLCTKCTSYVKGDTPIGYCFPLIGTSQNIHKENDCICETCSIFKEYELDHTFYCTRCSHICQTYKTQVSAGP